ncbi:MAG TPA: chemotaxis protein CheW [Anaeromyxobacter sp.]|nr:chemotaxis protein CheW [Anaeromyxobacter sp.]
MSARDEPARASDARAPSDDALVQLCTFRIGGEDYAVDIMRVHEIIPPRPITPVPRAPSFLEGVTRIRGEVLPVLDVRKRLGVAPAADARRARFLVASVAGRRIALVVDEVCEVLRLPRRELRPAPALGDENAPRFFLGVCGGDGAKQGRRAGAGRLRLLLNVKALLDPSVPGEAEAARAQARAALRSAREPGDAPEPEAR